MNPESRSTWKIACIDLFVIISIASLLLGFDGCEELYDRKLLTKSRLLAANEGGLRGSEILNGQSIVDVQILCRNRVDDWE